VAPFHQVNKRRKNNFMDGIAQDDGGAFMPAPIRKVQVGETAAQISALLALPGSKPRNHLTIEKD
jgi:hypothetical protein